LKANTGLKCQFRSQNGTPKPRKCMFQQSKSMMYKDLLRLAQVRPQDVRTKFIKKPHVSTVKEHLKTYTRLRTLRDKWIELSIDFCQLKMQEKDEQQN